MKIKTYEGEIETPEPSEVGERTKFWARAMQDLLRIEEIYCVMAAAQKEAYLEGEANALRKYMEELLELFTDTDAGTVTEGPLALEPTKKEGSRDSEGGVDSSLLGCAEESPQLLRRY